MVRMRVITMIVILAALLSVLSVPVLSQDDPGVLNIYSSRHYGAMEAPFVAFEEATGIEVRVSEGTPRDLLTRLQADIDRGGRSVADVFLAIDAGVLSLATERELLQPIESEILDANIPETMKDPDGHWYGLSQRLRTLVYNPEFVTEDELTMVNNYADLADATWEGRLCMRPASHIYTVSLMSSLVYHLGEETAQSAFEGISSNVVRYINSDTSQIKAVAAGECHLALVNHYYMGRLGASEDPADTEAFEAVGIKWMNQETTGNFFNINGAGVVVNSANFDNAVAFIEYMSSLDMQCGEFECFVGNNYEFPTNPEAEPNEIIAGFGDYVLDTEYPLWEYGGLQETTVTLLEEVGFGFTEN